MVSNGEIDMDGKFITDIVAGCVLGGIGLAIEIALAVYAIYYAVKWMLEHA